MTLDFALIASMGPELLRAAGVTLSTWLGGAVVAVVLGFVVAVVRRYGATRSGMPGGPGRSGQGVRM